MEHNQKKQRADALLEIGCEELPVDYIGWQYLETLRVNIEDIFKTELLDFNSLRIKATARRISFFIDGLAEYQKDDVRSTAPRKVYFDARGKLTKAGESFQKKENISLENLNFTGPNEKAEFKVSGERVQDILPDLFLRVFKEFEFPKTMRWEESNIRFARPIRWIVALYGSEVITFNYAGLESGRTTQIHPLHPDKIQNIDKVGNYETLLEKGFVLLDTDKRRTLIEEKIKKASQSCSGRWVQDKELLEMVNMMAEWPGVIVGGISKEYMSMPREIITTAMREHQRFFAVEKESGELLPNFLAIYDNPYTDGAKILPGNEKVLSARLKDALFFYNEDVKHPLNELVPELKRVLWIKGLGNLWDKTQRLEKLSDWLGEKLEPMAKADAMQAAHLSKADLISNMVQEKEYTSLQGIMGGIYAQAQGLSEMVAKAIGEQYLPRGANDSLPKIPAGKILALADKIVQIIGCWGAGFAPTGAKDPYALRRAAQGVIAITLDAGYRYSLDEVLRWGLQGFSQFDAQAPGIVAAIKSFFEGRLATELSNRGITPDLSQAVLGVWWDDMAALIQKAESIQELRQTAGFNETIVTFSRVVNILPKNTLRQVLPGEPDLLVDTSLMHFDAEKQLHAAYQKMGKTIKILSAQADFRAAFKTLGEMKSLVDEFFNQVMVMDENSEIRQNRLNLLANLARIIWNLADFSKLIVPN